MVDSTDGPLTLTAEKLGLLGGLPVLDSLKRQRHPRRHRYGQVAELDFTELGDTHFDRIDVLGDGKLP